VLRALTILAGLLLAAPLAAEPPHLEKRGPATQLVVDGQPFLILGGELGNSSASSREYMRDKWPKLAAMHLNTVLAPVTWETIEPQEGRFDFASVDGLIEDARAHRMHLVLLWFGTWKNSMSSYAPGWVKRDPARFPRTKGADGRAQEIISAGSVEAREADARAFAALMRHVRETDGERHTVLMVQVENEMGFLPFAREGGNGPNLAADERAMALAYARYA
jgi:beta-galactosidase GanA